MSTLSIPPVLPSPQDDVKHLYKAFKGMGCDTEAVVNILAHRDATQRALIVKEYKSTYAEDLYKRLESELTGKLERAVLMWMPGPAVRDANIIRQSMMRYQLLIYATEIICSRTSSQIQYIKKLYQAKYHAHLEHDIQVHPEATGDVKQLLMRCINKIRHEGPEVDRELAEKDAKSLYKAGEDKIGTDEATFIRVFTERSRAHLMAVSHAYQIKSETSSEFEFGLMTILQCAENPAVYYAELLHEAMKGIGTDDYTLTKIVVTRTETDMHYIKEEYQRKYGKTLNDAIYSETSGHYGTFLLSLIGPTDLGATHQ